jgi:hypothetical protein
MEAGREQQHPAIRRPDRAYEPLAEDACEPGRAGPGAPCERGEWLPVDELGDEAGLGARDRGWGGDRAARRAAQSGANPHEACLLVAEVEFEAHPVGELIDPADQIKVQLESLHKG